MQTEKLTPIFSGFMVIFHNELRPLSAEVSILEEEDQLAGGRDGFAINYGASGMGTILLANRQGIGAAKDCVEYFYEEFFLQFWANGDSALLSQYSDAPSSVHKAI